MELSDIQAEIEQGLLNKDLSAAAASRLACGNPSLIKNILNGHTPKVDSLIRLAKVLDINFQFGQNILNNPIGDTWRNSPKPGDVYKKNIGPPRGESGADGQVATLPTADASVANERTAVEDHTRGLVRAVHEAGGDPIPADLRDALLGDGVVVEEAARPVPVVEVKAAAGGGMGIDLEQTIGQLWFRRDWLDEHGLDATQCTVIGVAGESMEPTLVAGSKILINRLRKDWRKDSIYVVRTDDGLVVKRAGQDKTGQRLLVSDHPAWEDVPLPADAVVMGEVVWVARVLRS